MKIGIYCTNNLPFPVPQGEIYANMSIAGTLANHLTAMGHNVTFFASLGTQTKANLVTFEMLPFGNPEIYQRYPHEGSSFQYENIMMLQALNYMTKNNFDLFHSHTRPFSTLNLAPLKPQLPTALTIHDPLDDEAYKILPLFNQFKNVHLISLTRAQRQSQSGVEWEGNVYNGIDLKKWPFNSRPKGNYLLYAGRVLKNKGADLAVQIALKSGKPLKITGSVYPQDQEFFDAQIKPLLNDKIEYLGVVSQAELAQLYQNALAFLMPVRWPEPFGLVMIEAMASGTPVIASNRGSVPEVVKDSKTGFIIDDPENIAGFVQAVDRTDQINRQTCRKYVEKNFSVEKMVDNYLKLYRTILNRHG